LTEQNALNNLIQQDALLEWGPEDQQFLEVFVRDGETTNIINNDNIEPFNIFDVDEEQQTTNNNNNNNNNIS
jgi:hypothetical protein